MSTEDAAAGADEPERTDAVNRWTAEFVDAGIEAEFHLHHLDATARRLRTTSLVGAASCLSFTFADIARVGFGPTYLFLLALRVSLFACTVVFVEAIRREPTRALSWRGTTILEAAVLSLLFVVMALRPDENQINNLGISITIVACFLLVPNRFGVVVVLSTVAVLADVLVGALWFDDPASQQFANGFTLSSFLVIGAFSANQLQRARREEFVSLRQERRANDRLTGEIGRRRVLEDELTWMANHDALTDLLNRRAFYELADREAARARRTNLPVSIIVIDADEFKAVNDRFGHQSGDEALRRIAATCALHLRLDDVVGRIGGEEFAAIMPGANLALAEHVAERLRAAIAETPLAHPDGPIPLSVSIGVTEFRTWHETMVDAIHRADEAMYRAKTSGRNRVVPV